MNVKWIREKHPEWYQDIAVMRYLILGSFPPHLSKHQYPFYYPNTRNRFWKILARLAGKELTWKKGMDTKIAVEERYKIMKKLSAGVQNLGLEIERKGKSALDTSIRIVKFQDILSILNVHTELERILLPGFSAPDSTARSFCRYLSEHALGNCLPKRIQPQSTFDLQLNNRLIQCVVLNSTSPASRVNDDALLEQFRKYLH